MPTVRTKPAQRLLPLLLALALPAWAHDLWLEREAGVYTLHQGHRHSDHTGAEVVPYEPAAVKSALCLGADGATRPLKTGTAYPVRIAGDCAAVWVGFATGYWTKTAWETRNAPKTGIAGVLKSWLSEDSVKRLDRWLPAAAQPFGAGLEITPVADPFRVAVGDKLPVRVTENGQPRAGVAVAYQGATRGVTDEAGRIAIRLRHTGMQLIAASTETPLTDGQADTLIRATALQFELRP